MVFIKLGSLFQRGGANCVFISYVVLSYLLGILLRDPYLIPVPDFLCELDIFLTTPRILKFFYLFFNYFHLLMFYSFLLVSSLMVLIDVVLSTKFLVSVINALLLYIYYVYYYASSILEVLGKFKLILFYLNIIRHCFLKDYIFF
jgi:hypothetical protein